MNVIEWLSKTAEFLAKRHPGWYDGFEDALEDLSGTLDTLRDYDKDEATLIIGPFIMYRVVQEGVEEVFLSQKISSMVLFPEEEVCKAYGWADGVDLPDALDDDPEDW